MPLSGVVRVEPTYLQHITAFTRCPLCKVESTFVISTEELDKYNKGALIQEAFPSLSLTEREQLLTGYCGKCWDEMFAEEDDEDEEE